MFSSGHFMEEMCYHKKWYENFDFFPLIMRKIRNQCLARWHSPGLQAERNSCFSDTLHSVKQEPSCFLKPIFLRKIPLKSRPKQHLSNPILFSAQGNIQLSLSCTTQKSSSKSKICYLSNLSKF